MFQSMKVSILAHGGHGDLGVFHELWHAAPWLLGVGAAAWMLVRWKQVERRAKR